VYGGAIMLWWSAMLKQTEDPFILRWDLSKTDFLNYDPVDIQFLMYYNPYSLERHVELDLSDGTYTLENVSEKSILFERARGTVLIPLPPKDAVVLKLTPIKLNKSEE
jgi:hypothetical protein